MEIVDEDEEGNIPYESSWPDKRKKGLKITIVKNKVNIEWRAKFTGKGIKKKPKKWKISYRKAIIKCKEKKS